MKKLSIIAAAMISTIAAAADSPALLKGPVPTAPLNDWISVRDFPTETLNSAAAIGPADYALTISEKGRVTHCTVERSSGSPKLDETTCYIFEQRGRFQPATDSSGKSAIGVFRVDALWAVAGQTAPPLPLVEMAVGLQAMPQPLPNPSYVDIAERLQAAKVLGGLPCAQALQSLKLEAAKTDKGKPVRSVQMATILFMANPPVSAASGASPAAAPQRSAEAGSTPAPTRPEKPEDIVVKGRNITGLITRPEASVQAKGANPFTDFEPIGFEVVLLKAASGQWYRATLEPPCIGDSTMVATDPANPPGFGVSQNPDGSVDYRSTVIVTGDNLPALIGPSGKPECHMSSLVTSDPPKGWKPSNRPIKPPPPALAARGPGTAPDGSPIYPVQWQERPTMAQFKKIAGGWSGSGWILCQTAADYKVRNCRTVSESPKLSGVANRMKLESGNFRVKPPLANGQALIGAWVAIGFDFAATRKEPVHCDPDNSRDPC